ncbi:MAG: hypothetical protein WCI04_03370 [archaeon]
MTKPSGFPINGGHSRVSILRKKQALLLLETLWKHSKNGIVETHVQ